MKEDNNIFEKMFLVVMLSCIGLGLYVLVSSFNIRNVRNEIRKEFIKEGVSLGCIEYRIINKSTGETAPYVVVPKNQDEAKKLSSWFEVPLYTDHNPIVTLSTYTAPIVVTIASIGTHIITRDIEKEFPKAEAEK